MTVEVPVRRSRRVVVVDNRPLARAVGERIRKARTAAGLTQDQVAGDRYTGAYISALERGLAKPSLASLAYLAARLEVRIVDLVDVDAPIPTPEAERVRIHERIQQAVALIGQAEDDLPHEHQAKAELKATSRRLWELGYELLEEGAP